MYTKMHSDKKNIVIRKTIGYELISVKKKGKLK